MVRSRHCVRPVRRVDRVRAWGSKGSRRHGGMIDVVDDEAAAVARIESLDKERHRRNPLRARARTWRNSGIRCGRLDVPGFLRERSAGPGAIGPSWAGFSSTYALVTVTRPDRLARSMADLLHIAERIRDAGAGLRSLAEPWADTTTPADRMMLTVFAGIADFERSLIAERASAGRIAAKARGVQFGPGLSSRSSKSPMPVSSLR